MKNFNKMLEESKGKDFDDSADATEFMHGILGKMKTKQLKSWSKNTDYDFGVSTAKKLATAIKAYEAFLSEMEKAE